MSVLTLNYESIPKFMISLGVILLILSPSWLIGILLVYDSSTSKYITDSINLKKENLENEEISKIQKNRLEIPNILANSACFVSLVFFIGGIILFFLGFIIWCCERKFGVVREKENACNLRSMSCGDGINQTEICLPKLLSHQAVL